MYLLRMKSLALLYPTLINKQTPELRACSSLLINPLQKNKKGKIGDSI
jgi:hypothetical protein